MAQEINAVIQYNGKQIGLYSDDRDDYVSLTDMARAFKGKKSIESWLRNKNTLSFLAAWERYHNPNFQTHGFVGLLESAGKQHFNLSVKQWIDATCAIGVFAKVGGTGAGTYAHKDIALKFASWLSADFELFLIKEVQRLKDIERQKNSYELLTPEQVLGLVRLKEIFKYVAHQEAVEEAHKIVYASKSNAENPFIEFNKMRNQILELGKDEINSRIEKYCEEHGKALTKKMLNLPKREKIFILDSIESVKHAVWDFLMIKGDVNALNLATLVENMMRIEQGQVIRKNEDTLFEEKQDLGDYNDFKKMLDSAPEVKTAREFLEWRDKEIKRLKEQAVPFAEIIKRISKAGKPTKEIEEGGE